jgi:uncharacterized protein (TIGR00369 family)
MELDEETKRTLMGILNNSPMYRHMQMLVLDAGDGHSKLEMKAGKELHSLYGMLHGGVAATILDSACGIALGSLCEPGEMCVTVDMRINYISNMKEGILVGEGHVIHKGRQTGVVEAEIKDERGNLIAVGMSTQLICRPDDLRMADYPETVK